MLALARFKNSLVNLTRCKWQKCFPQQNSARHKLEMSFGKRLVTYRKGALRSLFCPQFVCITELKMCALWCLSLSPSILWASWLAYAFSCPICILQNFYYPSYILEWIVLSLKFAWFCRFVLMAWFVLILMNINFTHINLGPCWLINSIQLLHRISHEQTYLLSKQVHQKYVLKATI